MNFLQRTPFFRLLLALISGIIVSDFLRLTSGLTALFIIISMLILWFLWLIIRGKSVYAYRWLFGFFAMFAIFWIGFYLQTEAGEQMEVSQPGYKIPMKVRVLEMPVVKDKSVACKVQIENVPDSFICPKSALKPDSFHFRVRSNDDIRHKKIALSIQKDTASVTLKVGDVLLIYTQPLLPSGAMNPQGFDYRKFLYRNGIHYTAYVGKDKWKLIENQPVISIRTVGINFRNKMMGIFSREINQGDEFAVLSALILGYKEDISKETRENFSYAGAMHILAVSGLHVAIIYMLLQSVLDFLLRNKRWKYLKFLMVIAFLWFYALLTGLSPSVVRSAVMFSLVAIGNLLERKSLIYNTIAVSAFFMLIYDTNYFYDLGFQLSYSAVLSIIYFQPLIKDWFTPRNKVLKWFWDLTSVSLAAQMGTLPLILYYFNQFPNYFLLGNYVAIPLSTTIIYVAVAWLTFSFIPPVAFVLAWLNEFLLKTLNASVRFIHDLPMAVTSFYISFEQFIALLIFLILLILWIENRKYWSLVLMFLCLLSFVMMDFYAEYQSFHQQELIVYADRKQSHVEFIRGKNHQLFTTDLQSAVFSGDKFRKNLRLKNMDVVEDTSSRFLFFEGHKVLILKDNLLKRKHTNQLLRVDLLILDGKVKYPPEKLFSCIQPGICVISQSVSAWYTNQTVEWCKKNGIKYYSVAEKGAYRLHF